MKKLCTLLFSTVIYFICSNLQALPTHHAYVSNYADNSVSVLNPETKNILKDIPVGTGPTKVIAHPTEPYVYVANFNGLSLTTINTQTQSVVHTLALPQKPYDVAIRPSDRLYVTLPTTKSIGIVNIENPAQPFIISINEQKLRTSPHFMPIKYRFDEELNKPLIYVGFYHSGVFIFDTTNDNLEKLSEINIIYNKFYQFDFNELENKVYLTTDNKYLYLFKNIGGLNYVLEESKSFGAGSQTREIIYHPEQDLLYVTEFLSGDARLNVLDANDLSIKDDDYFIQGISAMNFLPDSDSLFIFSMTYAIEMLADNPPFLSVGDDIESHYFSSDIVFTPYF